MFFCFLFPRRGNRRTFEGNVSLRQAEQTLKYLSREIFASFEVRLLTKTMSNPWGEVLLLLSFLVTPSQGRFILNIFIGRDLLICPKYRSLKL